MMSAKVVVKSQWSNRLKLLLEKNSRKEVNVVNLGALVVILIVIIVGWFVPNSARSQSDELSLSSAVSNDQTKSCIVNSELQTLLELHNQTRVRGASCTKYRSRTAPKLKWSCALADASRVHAQDMRKGSFLGHRGSDNSTIGERATRAGYQWSNIGENAAQGFRSAEGAYQSWLSSNEHCKSIMNRVYRDFGAAKVDDYWVVMFGRQIIVEGQ